MSHRAMRQLMCSGQAVHISIDQLLLAARRTPTPWHMPGTRVASPATWGGSGAFAGDAREEVHVPILELMFATHPEGEHTVECGGTNACKQDRRQAGIATAFH
jgi:hypothetical protein